MARLNFTGHTDNKDSFFVEWKRKLLDNSVNSMDAVLILGAAQSEMSAVFDFGNTTLSVSTPPKHKSVLGLVLNCMGIAGYLQKTSSLGALCSAFAFL
jgi:hypothetical protein